MHLLLLLLLLLPSIAAAQTLSPTWENNAGVEYMAFQNGIEPTVAYAGCEDTWIDSANATTNHGPDSTLAFADVGTEEVLIRFDISAIPDSAVIVRAKLNLYMQSEGVAVGGGDAITKMARIYPAWVEAQATWNNYSTGNTWITAGLGDGVAQVTFRGASTAFGQRLSVNNSGNWTSHPKYGGLDLSTGTDTLQTASDIDASDIAAELFDPDVSNGIDAPRWIRLDLTEAVQNWHMGAWANQGVRLKEHDGITGEIVFKSSECGWEKSRPYLEIWYLYAVASSGGSGRRGGGFAGFRL